MERMQLSSISSLIAKGLNIYANKIFPLGFFFIPLQKPAFALSLWGIGYRLMRIFIYLINFRLRL